MMRIVSFAVILLMFAMFPYTCRADNITDYGDVLQLAIPIYAAGLSVAKGDYKGTGQLAMSYAANMALVYSLKYTTNVKRPDYKEGARKDSFPSGHASSAFAGAMFIHKRYGLSGAIIPYALAGFTGYSRIHAERHHLSDVVGAFAVSALCTWLLVDEAEEKPQVQFHIGRNEASVNFKIRF